MNTPYSHIPLTTILAEDIDNRRLTSVEMLSVTKNIVNGAVNAYKTTARVPHCAALDDSEFLWLVDLAKMRNGDRQKIVNYLNDAADLLPHDNYVGKTYRSIAAMMNRAPDFVPEAGFDS